MTRETLILGLTLLVLSPAVISAQSATAAIDPVALVRRAIEHRQEADRNHRPLRYLLRKIDERRDTTKDIVETSDGDVARLIAIEGQPLSGEANQAELDRLHNLAEHPEIQEHRKQREQKDAERVNRLMGLLPEALLYHFEGMVEMPSGPCYHLSFSPNPNFDPPDLEASIFRGMAGDVWIDQTQERLIRLEAHLIANVDFGWGIVGKLEKGGTILLEQQNVGGSNWELATLKLNMKGKALMFKTLNIQITEQASHFSPVPPHLKYQDAIQFLEKSSD